MVNADQRSQLNDEAVSWEYLGRSVEGDGFEIDGVQVWSHEWIDERRRVGVLDPYYGESHLAYVYEIVEGNKRICFAADERSPLVYAFYRPSRAHGLS